MYEVAVESWDGCKVNMLVPMTFNTWSTYLLYTMPSTLQDVIFHFQKPSQFIMLREQGEHGQWPEVELSTDNLIAVDVTSGYVLNENNRFQSAFVAD